MLSKLSIRLRSRLLPPQPIRSPCRASPPVQARKFTAAASALGMPARDKYSDPRLRDEVKEEIHDSDKGGAPGQWSARKAQMMASEYKKRGGAYAADKKDRDDSQKQLSKWTKEEWQTKEGSGDAKQEDGTRKRYLPKKAWEGMSEKERRETDEKKVEVSREGRQFVGNTGKAKNERGKVNREEEESFERRKEEEKNAADGGKKEGMKTAANGTKKNEAVGKQGDDEEYVEVDEEGAEVSEQETEEVEQENSNKGNNKGNQSPTSTGKKRGRPSKKDQHEQSNKKQKDEQDKGKRNDEKRTGTVGSRHDSAEPPAKQGSADHVPRKGQNVHWKSLPGFVKGKVVEVVYAQKEVEGKQVKGSEKDPRVVLKSSSSGKIASHKLDTVYFD